MDTTQPTHRTITDDIRDIRDRETAAAQLPLPGLLSPSANYQPRYLAYCRWHGRSPEAQLEADVSMAPFMAWVSDRISEWATSVGHARARYWLATISLAEYAVFAVWLDERVTLRRAEVAS